MSAIDENQEAADVRRFGFMAAGLIAIIFGMLLPWRFGSAYPLWPWIMATMVIFWSLSHPESLGQAQKGWLRVGVLLGRVNAFILLSVVFFGIVMPIGWVMRILGHDAIGITFDKGALTYRRNSEVRNKSHMEKPY